MLISLLHKKKGRTTQPLLLPSRGALRQLVPAAQRPDAVAVLKSRLRPFRSAPAGSPPLLPPRPRWPVDAHRRSGSTTRGRHWPPCRSEEHTSELQSLMRISYAVFCLKKKKQYKKT